MQLELCNLCLIPLPFILPQPVVITIVFSASIFLAILISQINEITQCGSSCVWPISHSIISSMFTYLVINSKIFFSFKVIEFSITYLTSFPLSVHPCFHMFFTLLFWHSKSSTVDDCHHSKYFWRTRKPRWNVKFSVSHHVTSLL
jgi:hypothetical protein